MATPKVNRLLLVISDAVRVMQNGADTMRDFGLMAQAAYLESAAVTLSHAAYQADTEEGVANLLAVTGRSVRALQSAGATLREGSEDATALETAAAALSKALHSASQDTVPIALDDIAGDK